MKERMPRREKMNEQIKRKKGKLDEYGRREKHV